MLEASNLECVRGEKSLFRGLSFRLEPGACLMVQGANGSGKTSLQRMICGLSQPAQGEIRWTGEPIRKLAEEYRGELLYCGHAGAVKDDLTALENARISATLAGAPVDEDAARQALRQLGLKGREDLPARVLSAGQKRRVALSRLLLEKQIVGAGRAAHRTGQGGGVLVSLLVLPLYVPVLIFGAGAVEADLTGLGGTAHLSLLAALLALATFFGPWATTVALRISLE